MRRLQILFALFAIALIAPVGLLVQRSLESIALERRTRQQAVAERIFDEMERSLSGLLEREEVRPIEGYEQAGSGADAAFVVSRFQVDAETAPAQLAARPGEGGPLINRVLPPADALDAEIARYFRGSRSSVEEAEARDLQAPGTTVRLNGDLDEKKEASSKGAKRKQNVSEYDALRSLNKALEERVVGRARAPSRREVEATPPQAGLDDDAPTAAAEVLDLRADAFGMARLSGRVLNPDRLMLYRTVARSSVLYQQGILIDVDALGEWLRAQSIGSAPYAAVELFTEGNEHGPAGDPGSTSYRHRFAPPFAGLSAQLRLQGLASGESRLYVQALSATLLAATVLGLLLLYRTVSVTVRFAERRSNFVAAVSHELKTPLTAIRMYGEMLRDGIVPSEAKREEYYRHITNESERLSRLINNVLEYAKLEKDERPVNLRTGSLAPTVAEVVDTMAPHAAERGFELALEIEEGLPSVRFEPDALMQVLWNLVDNAIKYARDATDRRILVTLDRHDQHVRISVRDRGPGVDNRHLGEIFEPFYRSENELTRTSKGTGLGLALVQSLVDRMGATVEGRNAPDGGFTVEIQFPVE